MATHSPALLVSLIIAFFAFLATSAGPGEPRGFTAPQWLLTTQNQSALWGYQLLGSNFFWNETAACVDISTLINYRWLGFGVETTYMERAFCDQASSNDTTNSPYAYERIAENIKFYNTNVFLSHLLFAFDTSTYSNSTIATNPFYHLCTSIRPSLLQVNNIQSDRFTAAICAYSNITSLTPPNAATPVKTDPLKVTPYMTITGTLFGYLLVSASTNSTEADILCDRIIDLVPSIANTGLDHHAVSEVACGKDGRRLSSSEAHIFLRMWQSKAFVYLLENASDDADWCDWLCDNLDVGAMNQTGLDGLAVSDQFCGYGAMDETAEWLWLDSMSGCT